MGAVTPTLTRRLASLLTLPLLLAACGGGTPTAPDDTIPSVQRVARPATAPCTLSGQGAAWLDALGGPGRLQGVNVRPRPLQPQAQVSPSVYDLMFNVRSDINTAYYGYSNANLNALHQQYEGAARTAFGNLKEASPTTAVDDLMNEYVDAFGDGHTYYLSAAAYKAFVDSETGAPTPTPRFGFSWSTVPAEDGAVLLDVLLGTPADDAGLTRGDTILSVNGAPLTRSSDPQATDTAFRATLSAAAQTARPVALVVRRGAQTLNVTVTPRVISSSPRPRGRFLNSSTYLLRIPTFVTDGTAQDTHDLIRAAQAAGARTLILDLRDNGGGLLTEAVAVAGAFVGGRAGETIEVLNGDDVTFAYRGGQVLGGLNCTANLSLLTLTNPTTWTGRTEVLVTEGSASGSEIVAQLLQKGGATLYGETTYGVGNTVTNINPLVADRGLSVTIGRGRDLGGQYLTASVTPAPTTPENLAALAHGTDAILQAALNAP